MEPGRVMGLDVGSVRTGVAISDALQMMALPHTVVQEPSLDKTIQALRKLVEELQPVRIVAGLPLDQAGQHGPQAEKVLRFLDRLRAVVEVEIVTEDERFSTAEAERMLIGAQMRRNKRKQVVDKVAATHILQTHLDRLAAQRRAQDSSQT